MSEAPVNREGPAPALDFQLLDELAYLRLKPFGLPNVSERLAHTPTLSRLASDLYGPASTLHARDQHQRALLVTAAKQMDEASGRAFLLLLGLDNETAGASREYRHDLAGREMGPKPVAGATLARRDYWQPFLRTAVAAIQKATETFRRDQPKLGPSYRDISLPVVEREVVEALAGLMRNPFPGTRAYIVAGPPDSGRFTICEQALIRATAESWHVIHVGNSGQYHRDLLTILMRYGVQAQSWSVAACELELQALIERAPESFGGVILRGASCVEEVAHLLPRRPGAHVCVTVDHDPRSWIRGIEVLAAAEMTEQEAVELLGTGHLGADQESLVLLAELLYRHAGLIAAAARANSTAATLIRRLRRARGDTILQLAPSRTADHARAQLSRLAASPDALLALDVALWVTGFNHWDLYHLLGILLARDASPSRVTTALNELYSLGLHKWSGGPAIAMFQHERASRITPLLHRVSNAPVPAPWGVIMKKTHQTTPTLTVSIDGHEAQVSFLRFVASEHTALEYFQICGALFSDANGVEHAQLWAHADYDPEAFVLYEDGKCRGDHRLIDPERDTLWPELTRSMLELLHTKLLPPLDELGPCTTLRMLVGPLHIEPDFNFPDVGAIDWDAPINPAPARDESRDYDAGEIFE